MKLIYDVHAITGAANYLAEHNPIMDASDFYNKIKRMMIYYSYEPSDTVSTAGFSLNFIEEWEDDEMVVLCEVTVSPTFDHFYVEEELL